MDLYSYWRLHRYLYCIIGRNAIRIGNTRSRGRDKARFSDDRHGRSCLRRMDGTTAASEHRQHSQE